MTKLYDHRHVPLTKEQYERLTLLLRGQLGFEDIVKKLDESFIVGEDDSWYIQQANEQTYGEEGSLEVDDNALISYGDDNGAYVHAWIWVDGRPPVECSEEGCTSTETESTPCGSFCDEHLQTHAETCEVCRSEFFDYDDDDEEDEEDDAEADE